MIGSVEVEDFVILADASEYKLRCEWRFECRNKRRIKNRIVILQCAVWIVAHNNRQKLSELFNGRK